MGVDAPQKIPKVVIVTEENSSDSPVGPSDALELGNYTLASPVEIAHHLKNIAQQGHMVTVFSNKGRTFILTRILDVDFQNGTLALDWGAEASVNEQFLASERNVFVCSPDGVKTQFVTGQARRIDFDGRPAFEVNLPEQVIKLQRREFFRIQTPVANPVICRIVDYPQHTLDLSLYDISLGGLSFWLPSPLTPGFDVGQVYNDCSLDLKALGVLQVRLEVRHRLPVQRRNGQDAMRIGCAFQQLPTAMENLIQRYVGQLERERRALLP